MAQTTTAPNNAAVKYRGKPEREMKTKPPRIGKRAKSAIRSAIKRGLISPKAASRHLGEA